ncbi:MAG: EamA family transporter [Holosporaceae bacterium]|jgi:drug/metabolite transporter (DMT)-like permease|nr:EamA family transporter [Holosporaceae bacterium]
MKYLDFFLILLQALVNSLAQVVMKKGVNMLNFQQSLWSLCISIATNVYIFCGVLIFVLALFLWLYLLSRYDLSFLYPTSSLAFVITALGGWFFLGESISFGRAAGIFLILMGVVCIAKS